ncbi:hypothetical protein NQZ68_019884 [Dissostichus eleginoides]|nr:hypothetical protein NQZ68_019884 [Dissostichus eleginoides]
MHILAANSVRSLSLDHQTVSAVSRVRLSEREEESLCCYLRACDAALSYLQELDKTISTPHSKTAKSSTLPQPVEMDLGYFLQASLQSAYLCLLQRGHLAQGAHQLRRVLRVVESRGSQSFRKSAARKLAEVLLSFVSEDSYWPPLGPPPSAWLHREGAAASKDAVYPTVKPPQRYSTDSCFCPQDVVEEAVLLLLITESMASGDAVISRLPDQAEARQSSLQDATSVYDLLTLGMARRGQYGMLSECLERAMKFSFNEFHLWHQLGLSLMAARKGVGAVSVFKECARMRPEDPSLLLLAAKVCIGQLQWFGEAEDLSQSVVSMGEEAGEFLPRAYLSLGLCCSLQASEGLASSSGTAFAFNIPITVSIGVCYNIAILFAVCYNITILFGICYNIAILFCVCYNIAILFGVCYNIAILFGVCYNIAILFGVCYNIAILFGVCYNIAILFGVCYNITILFGVCYNITILFGICYNIAILFGVCYNITILFGICSQSSLKADRNEFNKKALRALSKAHSLDPEDTLIAMYLSLQLALVRQVSAAIEPLQAALSLRGDDLHSLHLLTLLLSAQKHQRHALDTLNLALSQHPGNFNLLFTKAKLQEALFGPAVALQTCEEMLQHWLSRYDVSRSSETDDSSSIPMADRAEISSGPRKHSIHLTLPDFQDASSGSLSPTSVAVSRLEAALSEVSDISSTRRQGPTYIWTILERIWLQAAEYWGPTGSHVTGAGE